MAEKTLDKDAAKAKLLSRNHRDGEFVRGQTVNVDGQSFRVTRWDNVKQKMILKKMPGIVFGAPRTNAVPAPTPTESQIDVAERQSLDSIDSAIEKVAENIAVSEAATAVKQELKEEKQDG